MTNVIPYPRGASLAERHFENGRRRMLGAVDRMIVLIERTLVEAKQITAAYPTPACHEAFEATAAILSELQRRRTLVERLHFGDSDVVIANVSASLKELLHDARRRFPALLRELAHRIGG
jgi:hypothetical protein